MQMEENLFPQRVVHDREELVEVKMEFRIGLDLKHEVEDSVLKFNG